MSFNFDFDKLKEAGKEYAEKGKDLALDLTGKAKNQVNIVSAQAKLAKAQRDLGVLVYSLAKSGETNQPLMDKYIDAISALEAEIEQNRQASASGMPETFQNAVPTEPAVRVCPQCGAEVPEGALFCNKCGAQL